MASRRLPDASAITALRFLEAVDPESGRPLIAHTKSEWAGQPFHCLPWQRDVMRHLFGALRPDGLRQYRKALIGVARKNGKSAWASALALYMLIADGEAGAEVYSVAADKDQARIVFGEARKMLEASPLAAECAIYRDSIVHRPSNSVYRVLSSDAPTKHGLSPSAVFFDELHAQEDRELWDVVTTAQAARPQPLTVAITTAGFDTESLCYELYQYCREIEAGTREDPQWFFRWYGADRDDDWTDRAAWKRANPSLGHTVQMEFLEAEFREAEALPGRQNSFRTLYLNQWVEQATRWLDMAAWDAQAGAAVGEGAHKGRAACGGLDIGSVSDLTALAWVFGSLEGDLVDVVIRCWLPEAQLERTKNPRRWDLYRRWADTGLLSVTPGSATDYGFIKRAILTDCEQFDVRRLHIDRLFQGQQLMQDLAAEGVPVAPMGQGYLSMGPAVRAFERRYLQAQIRHGAHPILRWAISNAVVVPDAAGNMKFDKAKTREKIDPLVALVMAIDALERQPKPEQYQLLVIGPGVRT